MLRNRVEIQHINNGYLLRYDLVENGSSNYQVIFCRDKTDLLVYLSDLDLTWAEVED